MTPPAKDSILNIRISKETYKNLKKRALKNSRSVSQLVRGMIEDGMDVFDDISNDLLGETQSPILYYTEILLAEERKCSACDIVVASGKTAYIGKGERGEGKIFCKKCVA